MVTDPFDEAAGDCPFEDPQLPQPHLLAVLTALGSNLRLDTHSISRRTCEAVGIYKSAKTKRNEAKHIRRCLAHLESIDDAARHLSNLIEGRGIASLSLTD